MFYIFNIFLGLSLGLMANSLYSHEVFKKLDDRMVKTNSLVCVGLDPDISKMPDSIMNSNNSLRDKIYSFLTEIIDVTAPHVCCFKPQKAFYDQFDFGHSLLRDVVSYIHKNHPEIPVFMDCKVGDIDNTMSTYMRLLFDDIKTDVVIVNPYMGDDVMQPFMEDKNKAGIVLIQTSNPRAKCVQELKLENGKKLWQEMLELTLNRWNVNNNLMVVLSSNTEPCDYAAIRKQIPQDMPILLAGIGMQGGDPEIMKQLLNDNKRGVFVNSSRGIIYSYNKNDENWRSEVLNATLKLKNTLNEIRN